LDRLIALLVLLTLAAFGFTAIWLRYRSQVADYDFVSDYLNRFVQFSAMDNPSGRGESYVWLLEHAVRAQCGLNTLSSISFRPAFQSYVVTNYQLLTNTLPRIARRDATTDEVNMCADQLIMLRGTHFETLELTRRELRNPIRWLINGTRFVLQLPVLLLIQTDIVSGRAAERLFSSLFFRISSAVVWLISILSCVVTITTGWTQFKAIIFSSTGISLP
jgi:hypothetical protein